MLTTSGFRLLFLSAIVMASVVISGAQQQRWSQGGWGQMDPFDSSIMFDDDSPADSADSSAGWGDPVGWNDVNNRPFRPRQNTPNRLTTSATPPGRTTARTTARAAGTTARTTAAANQDVTSTTPRPNPQQTQCISRCPSSPEYNPVCGSNRMNYNNPGRLRCAASCGTDVQLAHYGVCRQIGQPQAFPRRDP